MSQTKVSVVIPNWNGLVELKENLPTVMAAGAKVDAEIIVVDDAGTIDDSLIYLKSLGNKITLIQNATNLGFGATVNIGVKAAKGDIVVLLNTDVRTSVDCLKNALPYFEDPAVFAVTFNSNGAWAGGKWEGGLLHHFPVTNKANSPQASFYASGGQAAFRKSMWTRLGGMDNLFAPFYWEDVDLSYRAWKAGYTILWAPDCEVVHDHKGSVIAGSFQKSLVSEVALRNQFLFVWKNITDTKLTFSHLFALPKYCFLYPRVILQALSRVSMIHRSTAKLTDQKVLQAWQ